MDERAPLFEGGDDDLSPHTLRLYEGVMRRYRALVPAILQETPEGVRTFLQHLDKKGCSRNYIRTCRDVLKANLDHWPFKRGRPKIRVDKAEVHRPALEEEEIRKMIAWARQAGDLEAMAFLAISTVYGTRCSEIAQIQESDFADEKQQVTIHTKKGGETRTHLVHEIIQPVLRSHAFSPKSVRYCHVVFSKLRANAGIEREGRLGWHSIRRALVTNLLRASLDPTILGSFLRWKMTTKVFELPRMIAVYDRRAWEEVDQAVFEVHPFLDFWR